MRQLLYVLLSLISAVLHSFLIFLLVLLADACRIPKAQALLLRWERKVTRQIDANDRPNCNCFLCSMSALIAPRACGRRVSVAPQRATGEQVLSVARTLAFSTPSTTPPYSSTHTSASSSSSPPLPRTRPSHPTTSTAFHRLNSPLNRTVTPSHSTRITAAAAGARVTFPLASAPLATCRPLTGAIARYPPPSGASPWWYHPWVAHSLVSGASRLLPRGSSSRVGRQYCGGGGAPPSAVGPGRSVGVARCEGGEKYAWPDESRPRICILGGGFGGLYTALCLDSLLWTPEKKPQVLLVDQSERFVFKPLLYELLSKDVSVWEIAPLFSDLLSSTDISFLRERVEAVVAKGEGEGEGEGDLSRGAAGGGGGGTGGSIRLASGMEVEYDWLVLSLGAETSMAFAAGAKGRVMPFATLDDALAVDRRLLLLEQRWAAERAAGARPPPMRVCVVGAGYSGVELACTVAERLGNKAVIEMIGPSPLVCPSAPSGNRQAAERVLRERGVQMRLGTKVAAIADKETVKETDVVGTDAETTHSSSASPATALAPCLVYLEPVATPASSSSASTSSSSSSASSPSASSSRKETIEADIVLWTVGNLPVMPQVQPAAATAAAAAAAAAEPPASASAASASPWLRLTPRGQALVSPSLRVKGLARVFALGDAAAVKDGNGRVLPATAQVAFQQADYVGWNIWAGINKRPMLPFRYQHLGEMITLGMRDAAVSVGFIDDFLVEGRAAHTARKLAYLYRLPTNEHKARVGASWLSRAILGGITEAQEVIASAINRK